MPATQGGKPIDVGGTSRPAAVVLAEALGDPRRRVRSVDDPTQADAAVWDCGCRARTLQTELRSWDACVEHAPFRDAVMARMAIVSAREG